MSVRRKPRVRHRVLLCGAVRLLVLILAVVGFGLVASRSQAVPAAGLVDGDVADAEKAIEALLDPGRSAEALASLPHDFVTVTGVEIGTQTALDGTVRAVHIGGGCSAPWGDDSTRWDFGTPCRSHDLGYDLLRYAEKKGRPLGPELREALDERLSEDMYTTCDVNPRGSRTLCQGVAAVYTAGLVVNSWHQRWGPPVGEPVLPLLAGVAVIGVLLWHRLRGRPLSESARTQRASPRRTDGRRPTALAGPWTLLGVGSLGVLILGESTVALAQWAGADPDWLWPLTWSAQTAVVFFFAAGHTNAATWTAIVRAGGDVRTYLAHRASRLLRLTLVFAVVAFSLPLALELLRVPPSTIDAVVRIALHPLWLLGFYLLTTFLTPLMLALHRHAPRVVFGTLVALLVGAEWLSTHTISSWPHHAGALALALLAQQAAFAHRDGVVPSRRQLVLSGGAAFGALVIGVAAGALPFAMLGVAEAPPVLAGPMTSVLLIGLTQLTFLGLFRARLARVARRPELLRSAGLASRLPMSLYLLFLTAVLLLVAAVYLPSLGPDLGRFLRPRALLATALLVGPAVLVFLGFERHMWYRTPPVSVWNSTQSGLDRMLSHAATAVGAGFALIGLFGFALTTLGTEVPGLQGLLLDPVQSLVHLLLGMSLLHSVHTGSTGTPGTWLLAIAACIPPLLSVTAEPSPDALGMAVHTTACLVAVVAAATTGVNTLLSPDRRTKT
ncbi:phospholipase A2 [Saccharomonospora sp.]|uniref:phospholipase A2 n=1 Tax=Saccharomonospora sp. TaxID=33913 RepID=UPI00260AC34C|nr:phospholipase A2 [Saccharomonospora sp.]